ncbi:MAG: hypothetical protein JO168_18370 [Solirubrobacterales bacterium]|nr:hypothetical protein [Solirubrobacterales bacterium]
MNPAPAHLESKLRFFWDLSVAQIAAAFVGIMLGFGWAKFGPAHGMAAALTGTYIAALLVIPVFVASQTDLDLSGLMIGALRWRRLDGRYVPGPGGQTNGYLLITDGEPGAGDGSSGPDLDYLWEEE